MKFKSNLEDLIKKVTNENNEIDWSKANEMLEGDVTKFIDKNVDIDTIKADANATAKDEFIKELGIDGVDSVDTFKQHLSKLGAEDKAQEVIRLTNELEALQGKYGALENDYANVSKDINKYKNEKFLASKTPNVEVDYLEYKINQYEGETFEDKYNAFIAEDSNKKYFEPVAPVKTVNSGVNNTSGSLGDKPSWETQLEEKYNIK